MKNLFILMAVVFISVTSVRAQDKGYLAVSLGPAIPTGDFASTNMDNRAAGYAKVGANVDITFTYKIDKYFGVVAMLRGQAHKMDAQALAEEMVKQIPADNISVRTEAESWSVGSLLIGSYGSFPIQKDLSIESRLMVGLVSAKAPKTTFNISTPEEGTAWIKQSSATGTTFGYLVGAGLKYNIGTKMCVLANIDYLGATPKYKNVELTSSFGDSEKGDYYQSLGSFNIGFGIGYRL